MKSKKFVAKILIIIAAAAVLAAAVFGVVKYHSKKKDFEVLSKNAVAMDTVITSKVYGGNASDNEQIVSIINQLEDTISWRQEGSAVWNVNHGKNVKLAELAQIVANCKDVSKDTDGRFDISIGKVASLWDIGGENERIPSDDEIKKALKSVDYEKISIAGGAVSCQKGQQIDLGAVGKGYACDMINSYLALSDVKGAVVSVGGSILAYGNRNEAGDKWRVAIKHPRKENAFLGTIMIDEGFVSTSGDYERYFEKDGKRYHHILDAKTGYPSNSDLISATVFAKSGVLADALSTACMIVGKDEALKLLEKYDCCGVLVTSTEETYTYSKPELHFEFEAE